MGHSVVKLCTSRVLSKRSQVVSELALLGSHNSKKRGKDQASVQQGS